MTNPRKPIPAPSIETQAYWDNLSQGRLTVPKCRRCGHRWFPPSLMCPVCHSGEQDWDNVSGRGTVFSFVIFHRVYHKAFADEVPYVVAVIELEEGPRLISNVIGIAPDEVRCGMKVNVRIEEAAPGVMVPKFAP